MWTIFICLIIFFFIIRPAYKVWRAVSHARKQAQEMNDAFRRAAGIDPDELRRQQEEQRQANRRGGWTSPAPKPKKISKDTGEYVRFKEVSLSETAPEDTAPGDGGGQSCRIETEEQIVDVSWEEIKQ